MSGCRCCPLLRQPACLRLHRTCVSTSRVARLTRLTTPARCCLGAGAIRRESPGWGRFPTHFLQFSVLPSRRGLPHPSLFGGT
eukprot:11673529-Alexandrium_andersonii.AAC.1